MKVSEFIDKFRSRYLWGNIIAMGVVVVMLCIGLKIGLGIYTHHGESIEIPDVKHKSMVDARNLIESANLIVEVKDTGYVKDLPADCVLEQSPAAGMKVKSGRTVYITINASSTPSRSLPDIVDNCSFREAMAKLKAMGFKVGMPQFITGEKDWVYGVTVDGKQMSTGDKIPIDKTVIIQVGNGMLSDDDSVQYIDFNIGGHDEPIENEIDDFEEVI